MFSFTVKGIDGTYTGVDHSRSGSKTTNVTPITGDPFIDRTMHALGIVPPAPIDQSAEKKILAFIEKTRKTVEYLITESRISDQKREHLDDIGIPVIISIYCSKGHEFEPAYFKKEMMELGLEALECHKLFGLMQKWREEASKPKHQSKDNAADPPSTGPRPDSVTRPILPSPHEQIDLDGSGSLESTEGDN